MLTMAQKMGSKTAFIGQVGKDQFGLRLGQVLDAQGIDTKGLKYSERYPTTLAFVHLNADGDRSFSFYRKGCADVMLEPRDIDLSLIENSRAFHFGSLSFTDEPSRSTVLGVLKRVKEMGKLISYDPNYRPLLWNSEEEAVEAMKLGLSYADIIKVSDEEAFLLTGANNVADAAELLRVYGVQLVCVTLGGEGVYYDHPNGKGYVQGFPAKVVDTTGAGDTFFGATVHQVLAKKCAIESLTLLDLEEILMYSNCAASLCIEDFGGIPAIPTREQVVERMARIRDIV